MTPTVLVNDQAPSRCHRVTVSPCPRVTARKASLMLLLATLFWGLSFPLMKHWQNSGQACPGGDLVASHTLMALRMLLGLSILALVRPGLFVRPTRREFGIGAVLGLLNFAGITLQMLGLIHTTPALSGFLTSLASAWVPLLAFVWFRTFIPRATLWGLLLGLAGAAVLGVDPSKELLVGGGEILTVVSTLIFAVMILVLDRWGRTVESAHVTISFVLFTGLPAGVMAACWSVSSGGTTEWLSWLGGMLQDRSVLAALVLLTVFSTVLGSLLLSTYQPRVPAARAALIYFLEPLFATGFSIALGLDSFALQLLLGGSLILLGNFLVELPALFAPVITPTDPPAVSG